jgi:hypothetical protein
MIGVFLKYLVSRFEAWTKISERRLPRVVFCTFLVLLILEVPHYLPEEVAVFRAQLCWLSHDVRVVA